MSQEHTETMRWYEERIDGARRRFSTRTGVILTEKNQRTLGRFLIHFCAQGVGMTELVPNWIRRAGEKTERLGMPELGQALVTHAGHEEHHHEMFIADTRALVGWWNSRNASQLDAGEILRQPLGAGVQGYRQLHEFYINGETPFCQIAIEFEVEKVSVEYGPPLFAHIAAILGPDLLRNLSFLKEHVAVDIGHTAYNRRAMARFLGQRPAALNALVGAGTAAISAYADYLDDCMDLARGS